MGEIKAMDRRLYYLHFPRAGATGEAPGLVGGGGWGEAGKRCMGQAWPRAWIVFSVGKARQGRGDS